MAARPEAVGGSELRQRLEQVPEASDDSSADGPSADSALVRAAMNLARADFEERTWQLFWQVVVEERSVVDVAADAGVSDWAVYKAKARVLKRLREDLVDEVEP